MLRCWTGAVRWTIFGQRGWFRRSTSEARARVRRTEPTACAAGTGDLRCTARRTACRSRCARATATSKSSAARALPAAGTSPVPRPCRGQRNGRTSRAVSDKGWASKLVNAVLRDWCERARSEARGQRRSGGAALSDWMFACVSPRLAGAGRCDCCAAATSARR